jgi:fatty acid desaturase
MTPLSRDDRRACWLVLLAVIGLWAVLLAVIGLWALFR